MQAIGRANKTKKTVPDPKLRTRKAGSRVEQGANLGIQRTAGRIGSVCFFIFPLFLCKIKPIDWIRGYTTVSCCLFVFLLLLLQWFGNFSHHHQKKPDAAGNVGWLAKAIVIQWQETPVWHVSSITATERPIDDAAKGERKNETSSTKVSQVQTSGREKETRTEAIQWRPRPPSDTDCRFPPGFSAGPICRFSWPCLGAARSAGPFFFKSRGQGL